VLSLYSCIGWAGQIKHCCQNQMMQRKQHCSMLWTSCTSCPTTPGAQVLVSPASS